MKYLKSTRRLISRDTNGRFISAVENSVLEKNVDFKNALPYRSVPGPKPLPYLGNTWRFIPFVGDFEIEHIDKVSERLYKRYGKIVKMEGLLGRPDMVFLFDPDDIEKVFRQEDILPYRPSMPSLNYYKHVYRKEFFGEHGGVIAVHGEKWQSFRSKVNQIMMQPRIAKMYVKAIESTAQEFVDRIEYLKNEDYELSEDLLNELHKWSLECNYSKSSSRCSFGLFGQKFSPRYPKINKRCEYIFLLTYRSSNSKFHFGKYSEPPTFVKYIEALDTIRVICMKYINKSLEDLKSSGSGNEISVLQRVLRLENDPKIAIILALDMFLVGIDTTSNAAASVLYQLAIHPDKQQILKDEVLRILPDTSTPITNQRLEQMQYLRACIKETMRMYPVVIGNGRQTTKDCVIFQHYVISNQEQYFPESKEFLPERWLKSCHLYKEYHPFASLPFGFGRRMCLGRRFAELELQILLAKVIRSYSIEYHHEKLDYFIHPMYTPNGPLKLKFIKR
ncbi:hypothetical protein NQ317_016705 [Molorchus minor]|uniref:Cytochrome P450 n=1 Tax=Molorchus minor TaxID=1323400 RepID=A0ABQ9J688_9CUCU|nr:hypothetical protein NQ317_016705 [Molorchus minor]